MRRLVGTLLVGIVSISLSSQPAEAAGFLDQEFLMLPVVSSAPITPALYYATAVTPQLSGLLSEVDIYVDRHLSAATENLTMSIFATSGGLPTGSALATSSVPASSVSGSYAWVAFNFPVPALIQAGIQFAIVLTTQDTHANAYLWAGTDGITSSPYPGGNAAYYQSGSWTSIPTYSQAFRTYVTSSDSGPTPPPVMQQFGKPASGTCDAAAPIVLNWGGAGSGGWGNSWAQWMNGGAGGAVCTRTLVYSPSLGHWVAS